MPTHYRLVFQATKFDSGLGVSFVEQQEVIPVVLARWLAVQIAGMTGSEDTPPVDHESSTITVGPFAFTDDGDQLDTLTGMVEQAVDLFGPDAGSVFLRSYEGVEGVEGVERLVEELSF